MRKATVREAQHHLSKLLKQVEAGEEVVLTRRGREVARLAPVKAEDPLAREVDWVSWVSEQRQWLEGAPLIEGNPVLEERESYRW